MTAGQRRAFLSACYGTARTRFGLAHERGGPRPFWAANGEPWAIVTAFNPGGRQSDPADNGRRQRALHAQLADSGHRLIRGVNGAGRWAEPSLIVLGAPLREALDWGRAWEQLAIVWGCGARAALVWCALPGAPVCERRWLVPLPIARSGSHKRARVSERCPES